MMENRYLKKLEDVFDDVVVSKGDEELISNMNGEYNIDADDIIYTDGFVVNAISKDQHYARLETAIRGGNYLIIAEFVERSYRFILYVNRPCIADKCNEIISNLNRLKENLGDLTYYINEWRGNGLSNEIKID